MDGMSDEAAPRGTAIDRASDATRPSPLQTALDRVGDRWCLLVVESLLEGPLRFNDLQTALPGIAPNILSDRLKRLERERVLLARPYSERPVRLSYELTAEGRELAGALRLLADCGVRDAPGSPLVLPDLRPGDRRGRGHRIAPVVMAPLPHTGSGLAIGPFETEVPDD